MPGPSQPFASTNAGAPAVPGQASASARGLLASPQPSRTHLVLIPSYNPGRLVQQTVQAARAQWNPVWVVVDGSTDESVALLREMAARDPGLRVIERARNGGKGEAMRDGVAAALAAGFTHVLSMDSDGQHPAPLIPTFMATSREHPAAMVLGKPVFDADAPRARVLGREVSNVLARLQTLESVRSGIGDCLYGFRVYPAQALARALAASAYMQRMDFDPEAVVRMRWAGVPVINLPAPVRYIAREAGGISHFRYGRDNARLAWMHTRLLAGMAWRSPRLLWARLQGR
ncbi:glycosyl transferase family 2 [Comamonas serinivorans]|uniref:Glycosyl transferase family 2 n=1 Tax=Comamonas serinivorans TaxID=1082851 RepID=A0A1Y0ENU3_9BURK|nr:glycosyl transferase family 2 [Comamonas serinivorans]